MLSNEIRDQPFQLLRGQPPGVRMLPAAVLHQPVRDIIAQTLAILAAVTGGQTISGFVKELANQQGSRCLSFRATGLLRPVRQHLLDLIPDGGVNDSGMLTLIDLSLVPDTSHVDRVTQEMVDVTTVKRCAAGKRALPRAPVGAI